MFISTNCAPDYFTISFRHLDKTRRLEYDCAADRPRRAKTLREPSSEQIISPAPTPGRAFDLIPIANYTRGKDFQV
jgi:hypothetical protein